MDPDELHSLLKQQPFEPIRIHISDGSYYDIKHPDQVIVSKRACHIGVGENGDRYYQRVEVVANVHITRLSPLKKTPKR